MTALIKAAKYNHADVVKLLLKCGANKDHQNKVTRDYVIATRWVRFRLESLQMRNLIAHTNVSHSSNYFCLAVALHAARCHGADGGSF